MTGDHELDEAVQQAIDWQGIHFQPTRRMDDAWMAVEKMHALGFETFELHGTVQPEGTGLSWDAVSPAGSYRAIFSGRAGSGTATATTAQRAICLAILNTLEKNQQSRPT